tara:strand:- start:5183 stop:5743 length:561 start_codon:yes stop_codon:yes gene_type:complete
MLQQNFYPGKVIQIWDASVGGTSDKRDADIPNPSYLVEELSSITTGPSANAVLIDATATFQDDLAANKFAVGDTVYQNKTFKHSRIVSVDSQTQLTVFDATFFPSPFASGVDYQIYRKSPYGCLIFAYFNKPSSGFAEVTDLNNNIFKVPGFSMGTGHGQGVLPFQCRKLVAANTDSFMPMYALFQ